MGEKESFRNSTVTNVVVLVIAAVVILGLIWWSRGGFSNSSGTSGGAGVTSTQASQVEISDSSGPAPKVGEQVPDFTASTLQGEEISIAQRQGRPLWLVFNATWCANCRAEMPDLQEMYQRYGDSIDIITVFVGESEDTVGNYAQQLDLTFPIVVDRQSELASLYRNAAVPSHYFVTADGLLTDVTIGALPESEMRRRVEAMVEKVS